MRDTVASWLEGPSPSTSRSPSADYIDVGAKKQLSRSASTRSAGTHFYPTTVTGEYGEVFVLP